MGASSINKPEAGEDFQVVEDSRPWLPWPACPSPTYSMDHNTAQRWDKVSSARRVIAEGVRAGTAKLVELAAGSN